MAKEGGMAGAEWVGERGGGSRAEGQDQGGLESMLKPVPPWNGMHWKVLSSGVIEFN